MGKKMKLLSLFRPNRDAAGHHPWQWPSCKQPETLSFRAGEDVIKTVNSIYFDPSDDLGTTESWFTNSSESASFSTESDDCRSFPAAGTGEYLENIVRGARSERLFFEPGRTSSILEGAKSSPDPGHPFEESVVLAMESEDPYSDFKKSMEEMVESHGFGGDWECLEELLGWYLKMNGKVNHGFIVGAFVDLLIGLSSSSSLSLSSESNSSFSSAVCCFSSDPASPGGRQCGGNDLGL